MPSYEEYCEAIKPIFESRWLTNMGPLHNEFKDKVGAYLGAENVSLFTNGHLALCVAIRALNLTGEIITTPFTFASTTHAIVDCGLTPVFCDVDPDTYTIDADKIEDLKSKIATLRNFGITSPESVDETGTNAKMNEFQAAMGLCNLKTIDGCIQDRKEAENAYRERLQNIPGIKICPVQENVTQNHAYFPIVFDGYKYNRDVIAQKLSEHNIFARKYFYPITNEFSCYKGKYNGEKPYNPFDRICPDR